MSTAGLTEQSANIERIICENEYLNFVRRTIEIKKTDGDGYGSSFLNLVIFGYGRSGEDRELALVFKTPSTHKKTRENFDVEKLFSREIYIYDKVLREFQTFQVDRKVQTILQCFPKYYYGTFDEPKFEVIVMDDLKQAGFETWDIHTPVTYEVAKMAVITLGKFHALSFAMRKLKPDLYKEMADNVPDILMDLMKIEKYMSIPFLKKCCENAKAALNPEKDIELLKRWENFLNTFVQNCNKLLKPKEFLDYTIIGHGSFWINNLMFKFKKIEGKKIPEDLRMLDFQLARVSSPIIDLSYFLLSCGSAIINPYMNELLKLYHDNLTLFMMQLGINNVDAIYSEDVFRQQWKQYAAFGLIWATVTTKIWTGDGNTENVGELSDDLTDENLNETYKYNIRRAITYCVENDII